MKTREEVGIILKGWSAALWNMAERTGFEPVFSSYTFFQILTDASYNWAVGILRNVAEPACTWVVGRNGDSCP